MKNVSDVEVTNEGGDAGSRACRGVVAGLECGGVCVAGCCGGARCCVGLLVGGM